MSDDLTVITEQDVTVVEVSDQGPAGVAATVQVGTVTTGAAGSQASVTNAGTDTHAVLNIAIPRGDTGAKGDTGAQGPQGPQGEKGDTGAQGAPGSGNGDVLGAANATDGHLAVFDGTTGKKIKDGGAVPASPVNADWNAASGLAQIANKPATATAANIRANNSDGSLLTTDAAYSAAAWVPLGNISGTVTIDASTGTRFYGTMTGNVTIDVTNLKNGQPLMFALYQDGTGNHTLSWAANKWLIGGSAPTIATAGNALAVVFSGMGTWSANVAMGSAWKGS